MKSFREDWEELAETLKSKTKPIDDDILAFGKRCYNLGAMHAVCLVAEGGPGANLHATLLELMNEL